ncbi:hypothetical protein K1T71_003603 [Dendrolimus kikuchii]|uniref:Uncharacterized protein n=1 Tax=Dendrolimus kikuchii TaxID=765133 RepID=A0ACC1D8A3_9NEOP|nr:hypothetical protein K1T71_003603 [Dendrolimus kikuchii]
MGLCVQSRCTGDLAMASAEPVGASHVQSRSTAPAAAALGSFCFAIGGHRIRRASNHPAPHLRSTPIRPFFHAICGRHSSESGAHPMVLHHGTGSPHATRSGSPLAGAGFLDESASPRADARCSRLLQQTVFYLDASVPRQDTWRGQLVSHRWAGECAWTACGPRVARLRGVFGARAIDSLRAAAAARCWLRFSAAGLPLTATVARCSCRTARQEQSGRRTALSTPVPHEPSARVDSGGRARVRFDVTA